MSSFSSFKLITEQDDFILIDKFAGVNCHDEGCLGAGLFNQAKQQLALKELYPVHRLDKMTSGLVILAKNLTAAQQFQELFSQHKIEKYYLALSDKKPKKKQGLIKGDMVKSRRGTWKLLRHCENPALTQFFSYGLGSKLRLFILKPHSGKTHQLRVALNSLGTPILGDNRYGGSSAERGYLHALAIKFTLNQQDFQYISLPNQGELFLQAATQDKLHEIIPPWQLNWPNTILHKKRP